ncbi:MAG: dihydroorotate dehydrogenase [Bacteroidetes bacterium]|nr:dihydroorotate dehydrogenase [Bacteroidota bacterium]
MLNTTRTTFKLRNVEFRNRVFVASGTFGYGDEVRNIFPYEKLGGIITKSLSLKPRAGNPPPRIVETSSGVLNSIGLANIGVEAFIHAKLPVLRTLNTSIITNIAASSVDEYCAVLERLESVNGVHAYEINVSCPNVKEGGLNFGTSATMVATITKELRRRTEKPLIVKLTPNVTHIADIARAAAHEGADAVSLINTLIGMAIDVHTRRAKLSTVTGGVSGPAIKPIALAKVFEVSKAVSIPVFGIGGIATVHDALEFLLAGASAIQVGTMNFVDPLIAVRIADGIDEYCRINNIEDVGMLVGSVNANLSNSILQTWL